MFILKCQNKKGDVIDLTDSNKFAIVDCTGLNPPEAVVLIDEIPFLDGGLYRSSKLLRRQVAITLRIKKPVSKNILDIYRVVSSKNYVRLMLKTDYLDVYTDGYVSLMDCNHFSNAVTMQIVIDCPSAYFSNSVTSKYTLNDDVDLLSFPYFTMEGVPQPMRIPMNVLDSTNGTIILNNLGDAETGFVMRYTPKDNRLAHNIMIKNVNTGEFIFVPRYATPLLNESIIINTNDGEKGIFTEYVDPNTQQVVKKSIIGGSIVGSWLKLSPGENTFIISINVIPEGYVTAPTSYDDKVVPDDTYLIDTDTFNQYYKDLRVYTTNLEDIKFEIEFNDKWAGV